MVILKILKWDFQLRQTFNVDVKHIQKSKGILKIFKSKNLKIRLTNKVKKKLAKIEISQNCKVIKTGKLWHLSIRYKKKK